MLNWRPCLNDIRKEFCMKTKLIALDWKWVTLISWCQINRGVHRSPEMHNVEGKTHNCLEKSKVTSWKMAYLNILVVTYLKIPCVYICISLHKLHTCLTLWWPWLRSTTGHLVVTLWFRLMQVKTPKTTASSWVHRKLNYFENLIFCHFYDSPGYIK